MARGQEFPSIEMMIAKYDPPAKTMCRTVSKTGFAPFEFILALYADYCIHRLLDEVDARKRKKVTGLVGLGGIGN